MESPSPETIEAPETPSETAGPDLFLAPVRPGRPSSMSMSAPPPSNSNPNPNPLPGESSTDPDPSSSTRPRLDAPAGPAPATSPASPSEDDRPHTLHDTIAGGITAATSIAHHSLTDDVGRAHNLYLATEEEVEMAAGSASAIIGRRLGPVVGSSELADVVQLGLAVISYATRTFQSWRAAREHRAALRAQMEQNGQQAAN